MHRVGIETIQMLIKSSFKIEVLQIKVRKAIIPAVELGARFLLATKAQPEEMLLIVDKPALQYIIEEVSLNVAILDRYIINP